MSVSRPWSRLIELLDERGGRLRGIDGVVFLLLGALATVLLWHSWGKWLHPITDSGRDLYIPEHLLAGKKLYRDLLYEYPPLAPYLLAGLVAALGSSLATYTWIGIVTALLITCGLYELVRTTSSRWGAIVVAFLFVGLHLTNKTAFGSNFIFPYSHALVFGLLFLLWSATFLVRFMGGAGRDSDFWIASTAGLLAGWSRLEFALTIAALFSAVFVIRWIHEPAKRKKTAAMFAGAAAAAATSFLTLDVYFTKDASRGTDWLRDNLLYRGLFNSPAARAFHEHVDGTDFALRNALAAFEGFMLVAAAVVLIHVLSRMWSARRPLPAAISIVMLIVVVIAVSDLNFFRAWTFALPALALALVLPWIRRTLTERLSREEMGVLLILLVLAAVTAPRIALQMAPVWYGFALFVPIYPLLAFVLFRALPRVGVYPAAGCIVWSVIAVLIVAGELPRQFAAQDRYRFPVDSTRGRFYDYSRPRAESMSAFLEYARAHPIRSLVVLPEGSAINYFARIDTPIRYLAFVPDHLDTPAAEAEVMRELKADPPDRIIVNPTSMEAFGYGLFGKSYGTQIARWISANYVLEQRWSWMLLLARQPGAPSRSTSRSNRAAAP